MFHGQLEGPDFEVLDPWFKTCISGLARAERL